MRVLVTGSAGFLASWLIPSLQNQGHEVIGIDLIPERQSNIFIKHDLRESPSPTWGAIDACIHLASSVGGFIFNAKRTDLIETEIAILKSVIHLSKQSASRYFIFTSSINVFETSGMGGEGPLQILDQKTPYAKAKAAAEYYIENHMHDFTVIRPTNFFAANQPKKYHLAGESHVIPDLLYKIDHQDCIKVLGDGSQI